MSEKHFVHASSYVDEGVNIGEGTKVWHFSHISKGAQIGEYCNFGQNVFIANDVKIGNRVKIQNNVSVYEGVTLEDYVFCGPSMVFTNVRTPRCEYPRNTAKDYADTLVKRGASIGANATVVCGTTLGKNAFIGAGAVVTKDVPDYAMVYGNPAQIKGYMCACGDTVVGQDAAELHCARCKLKIQLFPTGGGQNRKVSICISACAIIRNGYAASGGTASAQKGLNVFEAGGKAA